MENSKNIHIFSFRSRDMYSLHMQLKQRYSFLQFYRLLEEVRNRPCKNKSQCNRIHTPLTLIYVFIMDIKDNLKDISLDILLNDIFVYLSTEIIWCFAWYTVQHPRMLIKPIWILKKKWFRTSFELNTCTSNLYVELSCKCKSSMIKGKMTK